MSELVEPDAELFAAQYVKDALGEGIRIYTSHDELYEMRQRDGTEVRVYPAGDAWQLKARYTVGGDEEAYALMQDLFDRVEDWTGSRPELTIGAFHDAVQRGYVERGEDDATVVYRTEHAYDLDIPTSRLAAVTGSTAGFSTLVGVGGGMFGVVGGALGGVTGFLLGGPPGAMAMGAGGAKLGGGIGGALGALAGLGDLSDVAQGRPEDDSPTRAAIDWFDAPLRRRKERKRLDTEDRVGSVLDRVNEKRALDVYMRSEGTDYDTGKAERHAELTDSGVEDAFNEVWTIQFADFEKGEGVSVVQEWETYADALDAAADLPGLDAPATERPSIYTDRDALHTLLEQLPEQDRKTVIRNVLGAEPAPAVRKMLDQIYGELVAEAGRERSLETDA